MHHHGVSRPAEGSPDLLPPPNLGPLAVEWLAPNNGKKPCGAEKHGGGASFTPAKGSHPPQKKTPHPIVLKLGRAHVS